VEESFIRMLALRLEEVFFTPGEFIIHKDEHGDEMYIIKFGHAQVVSDDGSAVWANLTRGSYFGSCT
jgi:CRP-like cAMP-binding protein